MSREIQIKDKEFELFITEEKIRERIHRIAGRMNRELKDKNPLFIAVLNGSFLFAAELLRHLNFLPEISFVKLSSYRGTSSTGEVNDLIGLNEDLRARNVVILEDIIDTGITIDFLIKDVKRHNPSSIKVATLTFKKQALVKPVDPDYIGFEVPNTFLVGFGLDYDQLGRNLNGIYKLKDHRNA